MSKIVCWFRGHEFSHEAIWNGLFDPDPFKQNKRKELFEGLVFECKRCEYQTVDVFMKIKEKLERLNIGS